MPWYYDPQSGGLKIPPLLYDKLRSQAHAYEKTRPWYPNFSLRLRFKSQFCYLDTVKEGESPDPLGRLHHFTPDSWSLAFYAYSSERYEPCVLLNGDWSGSFEEAIAVCEIYLNDD
jgi:hypothetical protein